MTALLLASFVLISALPFCSSFALPVLPVLRGGKGVRDWSLHAGNGGDDEKRVNEIRMKINMLKKMGKIESGDDEADEKDIRAEMKDEMASLSEEDKKKLQNYKPARGSWGVYPRPKNISTAYGGGKRVGVGAPGASAEEAEKRRKEEEETLEKLRVYREKVGRVNKLEKANAAAIQKALETSRGFMMSGQYARAVSELEDVSMFCSSGTKLGGEAFLELAMAYEASGRVTSAVQVYTALVANGVGRIRTDAKRLLFGLEAMTVLKTTDLGTSNAKENARSQFIDTNVLNSLTEYGNKAYSQSYVNTDSDGSLYKRLKDTVVETSAEAREIILKATVSGVVSNGKVVQSLKRLDGEFLRYLEGKKARETVKQNVPVIDGVPIVNEREEERAKNLDEYVYMNNENAMDSAGGSWKLQLCASKSGETVKFYADGDAWMKLDFGGMEWKYFVPGSGLLGGLAKVENSGEQFVWESRRILGAGEAKGKDDSDQSDNNGDRDKNKPLDVMGSISSILNNKGNDKIKQFDVICVDDNIMVTKGGRGEQDRYYWVWRKG